ncbi:cytochrome d ubiquinol oxidase subunit II [Spinactinospora alkalitolerans]|uniref:Cytochrome d ubiquinol oxidase subunit II n=1 Tax=Spinactinospora alkalitolerans TaxID=687207 RepID=A0A852TP58_9ACTN|nr:cytochrome d ubiquinol oxidase subunit II [Spinactinospora alkalitolerans]NYE45395.1 cytochrome d ubiquinol oxidase subunit II [Spinactinospora alkalitolerans]
MDVIWLSVLGLVLCGWFVLDGFAVGLGVLHAWIGRDDRERRTLLAGVGPFFLGGEVWLVVAAGVLIAAFPALEVEVFTAFRPLIVLLLIAWAVRSASWWMRSRREDEGWRRGWDAGITAGSIGFAATWGMLLANLARGVPSETPSVLALFDPLASLGAVTVVLLLAVHGATFASIRVRGETAERARTAARVMAPLAFLAFAGTAMWVVYAEGVAAEGGAAAIVLCAVGAVAVGAVWPLHRMRTPAAFAASAVAAAALPLSVGVAHSGALLGHAASVDVLTRLAPMVLPVLFLALSTQVFVWWIFRRRVGPGTVRFF